MADSKIDLAALGQALDSTWGRSSTPKTASYSVKLSFAGSAGNQILASYAAIVNFGTERQMIEMKRAYAGEADSVLSGVIKKVKAIYKDLTGSSLTVKEVKDAQSDSIEITGFNCHNARRSAYFRRKVLFEVG